MNHGLVSRRWLFAWAIVLGFMLLAAWTIRDARFRTLARQATAALAPYAEQGIETAHFDSAGQLLYYENDYLWKHQGPMIWLIEQGYRDPAMLRVMLLCEARRSEDQVYLYTRCFNWDLREHLIAACRTAYPGDPLVDWATGRLYLAAGYYGLACRHLLVAYSAGLDYEGAGVKREHACGRIIAALIMDGRPDEAIAFAAQQAAGPYASAALHHLSADLLCELERYPAALAAADAGLALYPDDTGLLDVKYRALWWPPDHTAAAEMLAALEQRMDPLPMELNADAWRDWVCASDHAALAEQLALGTTDAFAAAAELHAQTGDGAYLALMENAIARRNADIEAGLVAGHRPYDTDWVDFAVQELLRAHTLAHDWDGATELLAEIDRPRWDVSHAAYQAAQLLTAVASAGPLVPEADSHSKLRALIEGGSLPFLLNSSHFRAAVDHAGRDANEVRAEVIAALAPLRETYSDSTNGTLDW